MHNKEPRIGDLRIEWVTKFGFDGVSKFFYYPVNSVEEAQAVLEALAYYDLYQTEEGLRDDDSNMGDLQVYEMGSNGPEWEQWINDEGDTINELDIFRNI
jgi:Superinfection exclusion gene product 17